jgi:predicted glycosyltransferase
LEEIVDQLHSKGIKILLSLEDKSLSGMFEKKCIILQEPVKDIYSLMTNALFTISSGDTMAREACLLSTPGIYIGGRVMLMNTPLIEKGLMFKEDTLEEISRRITFMLEDENALKIREKANRTLMEEWEDTTSVILKHILDFNRP